LDSAVILAAGHWYAAGTFWAAASVVVALAVGIATFLVTWSPRRRLLFSAPAATPLLTSQTGIEDLEIRHHGRPLQDPHLVDVTLTARGRGDIPSSAFDQARPLVFDLNASIVDVLQTSCDPASAPLPPVTHEGTMLNIGPELIIHGQTIRVSVLVDGASPWLTCAQAVLAHVTVAPRTSRGFNGRQRLDWGQATAAAAALAVVTAALAGVVVALVAAIAGMTAGAIAGVATATLTGAAAGAAAGATGRW
jgi:hypothetical protein